MTVQLQDVNANPIIGVPVTLSQKSGPGTVTTPTTLTQPTDSSGTSTFADLSADKAGQYVLTATGQGLTLDSSAFTVTAGSVALITLTKQPTPATQTTDGSFSLTAHVTDGATNPVAGASVSLTLLAADGVTAHPRPDHSDWRHGHQQPER